MLSEDQQCAFDAALSGKSMFITGAAGCGKSYLLRKIIKSLEPVVTSSQWSSAKELGGVSVHSALQIDPNWEKDVHFDNNGRLNRKWLRKRLKSQSPLNIKSLVIDEISLISGDLFSIIVAILELRCKQCQLIVCGDFVQLPPIEHVRYKYAFDSPDWNLEMYELTTPFRQNDHFFALLQQLRNGADYAAIRTAYEQVGAQDVAEDCCLAPLLKTCRDINFEQMTKLGESRLVPEVRIVGAEWRPTKTPLPLCNGAKIVLTKSMRPKQILYNGRITTIKRYYKNFGVPDGRIRSVISNYSSICRKYPQRMNRAAYAALDQPISRWMDFHNIIIEIDGKEYTIQPYARICGYRRYIRSIEIALPVQLGWAITYHRAQGMTIDSGILDLNDIFEPGMVYMGLSRFRDLSKIKIKGEFPCANDIDPRVIEFYRNAKKISLRI